MKVLHVVQGYTPAIGGTEFLIQKLSEQLAQRYGDEVTVFTTTAAKNCSAFWLRDEPTLPAGVEIINGVTVHRFPVFNRFGFMRHNLARLAHAVSLPFNDWLRALFNGPIVFKMTQEIARFKADVISASSFPFLHMHYALAGGRRRRTPVVLCGALHPTDWWSFDRPMIYKAIARADAYIAHSRFEQEYLVEAGHIPAGKVKTIGVGIGLEQFALADGQKLRRRYDWGQAPVIAFVGHLANRKGVPHLLATMPLVWDRYPEAKLLLAGSRTPYFHRLQEMIAGFPPEQRRNVVIEADFPERDKADIFSACDLLVLPSTEESFGIVFLEAWACRKPVVGLWAGAIPSIVSHGVDGLLARPHDALALAAAICELLSAAGQREQLGAAGYAKVKRNYTWDKVAAKFREVYKSVQSNASK